MTLNQNQLQQSVVQGQIDLQMGPSGSVIPCQVYASEGTPLVPGQAVKLIDSANGVPKVTAVTAATDDVFGFVAYAQRTSSFAAGDAVEIALVGTVMYMTANGAIARGGRVMWITGIKVGARTVNAKKTVIGWAVDKAASDGDLIRVFIQTPSPFYAASFTDLADAPAVLTSGDYLKVDASGTGIVNSAT